MNVSIVETCLMIPQKTADYQI